MLIALLMVQSAAASILSDAWKKIDHANSITVTRVKTTEEFKGESRTSYFYRKGGYFRAESGDLVDVSNPQNAWTYKTSKKIYQKRPPLGASFSIAPVIGFDFFASGLPVLSGPTPVRWHGKQALRIELDGRKVLTKETKLYVFVGQTDHIPLGISANLGSATQVTIFENLKIDSKIPDTRFNFVPPADWKLVTSKTGGWN